MNNKEATKVINKTIHYCWFGGNEKSELILKCKESWKKALPDYEIVEWNESNFNLDECNYCKEAYNAKYYAFVSDFARFYILYNYGGIYLDVDVEVVRPLDRFLSHEAFMGFEASNRVAPGLIVGSRKGNSIIKEILDSYYLKRFDYGDDNYNLTTVVSYTTEILVKHKLKLNNKYQELDYITIYPRAFFCPISFNDNKEYFTKDTYTIHHYAGTWLSAEQNERNKSKAWRIISPLLLAIKRGIIRIAGESFFYVIKAKVRRYI